MKQVLARWLVAVAIALTAVPAAATAATRPIDPFRDAARATVFAPLPSCSYADVLTARRAYTHWATTLLDTTYRLPSVYYPGDLVPTGLRGGGSIRQLALTDLRAMDKAARAAGARFAVSSAFRSFSRQATLFKNRVAAVGKAAALRTVARAGHSEHQLGTAIDFRSYDGRTPFATTRAGIWMKANAWKFGWVMSYPSGKSTVTCYGYEPWHYRYVGRTEARSIHYAGITLRQWLWRMFGS
jgi:D-alanyl-D-alanine carboxypeptidase